MVRGRVNREEVEQKIEEVIESLFLESKELRLQEFILLSQEDEDFRLAFEKLGIFKSGELD